MQMVEKTTEADIETQLGRAVELAKEFGATRLILFGSAADNPLTARDIDLACDGVTGWAFYELGARLEEELQKPLDLVPLTPPNRFTRLIEQRGKVLI
jgi:predicted nucleotidyltransferase